jgi:pimeloyl-ACP methyl ester carboxylesterase
MLPIILVPGLAGSLRSYADILPGLWRHGPLTVARPTEDDTMAAIAARILADAPSRFVLVGHSMGGYVALEIMRQAAERVARLALLNTSARTDTPEVTEARRRRIALTRAGRYAEQQAAAFPNSVHPSRSADPRLMEISRLAGEDVGPDAFIRQQTAIMGRSDSRPLLAAIRIPTLVLTSDTDLLVSNAFSQEMADLIPGARLVIVPDCGHSSPSEKPQAVVAALDDLFARTA